MKSAKKLRKSKARKINAAAMLGGGGPRGLTAAEAWPRYQLAPGVLPAGEKMAMDRDDFAALGEYAQQFNALAGYADRPQFLGYPALAQLAQIPEYRRMVGTLAQEMTRNWGKVTATGDGDKSQKVKELTEDMREFDLQEVFRAASEHDGFYGRGQIYVDTGDADNPNELRTPLLLDKAKLKKGALKGFRTVEAIWSYPAKYNSTDPLKPDYYRPTSWYVMGKEIHASRLMTLVSREVPDILKPLYMFGGIALTQLAKRYVENWVRTQQSVADLIESFTVWIIKTNLEAQTQDTTGTELNDRIEAFARYRTNRGVAVVDMVSEDVENLSVPLSGLDELQAQAQEHMASVDGMPLVKFFGITPSGLNATSEGELESWDDRVHAQQEHLYGKHIRHCLGLLQLNRYGSIDPGIGFEWNSLDEPTEAEKAATRKTNADTAAVYIDKGVLLPEEERDRVANEEGSLYSNIDLSIEIAPPEDDLLMPDADGGPDDEPTDKPDRK